MGWGLGGGMQINQCLCGCESKTLSEQGRTDACVCLCASVRGKGEYSNVMGQMVISQPRVTI